MKQELAKQGEPSPRKDMRALLERVIPEIEKAIPAAIGAERFNRIVLTEMERTPTLYTCEPKSVLGAMMLGAQLGLEPGPLGQFYLVPFKDRARGVTLCTFLLGYRGMIALAFRSDQLRDIEARAVREGDDFEWRYGLKPVLRHKPADERGEITHVYGLARFRSGGAHFQVLTLAEVEARRARSAASRAGSGPWVTDFEAMCCKTAIRAMQSYLPLSPFSIRAFEADEKPVPVEAFEADDVIDAVAEEDVSTEEENNAG